MKIEGVETPEGFIVKQRGDALWWRRIDPPSSAWLWYLSGDLTRKDVEDLADYLRSDKARQHADDHPGGPEDSDYGPLLAELADRIEAIEECQRSLMDLTTELSSRLEAIEMGRTGPP